MFVTLLIVRHAEIDASMPIAEAGEAPSRQISHHHPTCNERIEPEYVSLPSVLKHLVWCRLLRHHGLHLPQLFSCTVEEDLSFWVSMPDDFIN